MRARSRTAELVLRGALVLGAGAALHAVRPGVVENGARSPRVWLLLAAVLVAARLVALGVRRLSPWPGAAGPAGLLVVVVALGAVLAPSFQQRTVDEPFAAAALPSTAATSAPSPHPSSPPSSAAPSAAPPAAAPAATPVLLAVGQLEGVGHRASGRVALYGTAEGPVLRFEDVDVEGTPGPEVHLLEAGERSPHDGSRLAALTAEVGSFGYAVPGGTDERRPLTVLVWCRPYGTPVAVADLVPA